MAPVSNNSITKSDLFCSARMECLVTQCGPRFTRALQPGSFGSGGARRSSCAALATDASADSSMRSDFLIESLLDLLDLQRENYGRCNAT